MNVSTAPVSRSPVRTPRLTVGHRGDRVVQHDSGLGATQASFGSVARTLMLRHVRIR